MSLRDTPTTYSAEEAARIHKMAAQQGSPLFCPRCGASMSLGPRVNRHDTILQEVSCPECQRCIMLREPADPG